MQADSMPPEESNLVAYESVKRNQKAVFGLRDSWNSKTPIDSDIRYANLNANCGVGGRPLHVEGPTYREPGEIPGRSVSL